MKNFVNIENKFQGCPLEDNSLLEFISQFNKVLSEIKDEKFVFDFMSAPAAKSHHQNYVGGLLEHSFKLGCYLYSRVQKIGGLTCYQTAKIAICHDFCKVGLYTLQSDGSYAYDKQAYCHHALRSVEVAERFFELSQAERVCILLHMAGGWWNNEDMEALSDNDKLWLANNFQLVSAVQWADMKAC